MIPLLLFISTAFSATLLDETMGIVGRDVDPLFDAETAHELVESGNWFAAAKAWDVYGEEHPESEDIVRLWSVSCLIRAKAYGDAVHRMRITESGVSLDLRLGLLMSWIEVETGVYKEAFRLASLYPENAPDHVGAQLIQLRSLWGSQKFRKHRRMVDNFIESGSTDAWFWFDVGQSALNYQQPAQGYFEQAIEMNYSSPIHYRALLRNLEPSDTRSILRYAPEAVKLFPKDQQLRKMIEGYADNEQLIEAFQIAADASPEHGKIQWLTAILLQAKDRYSQASEYLRAAIDAGEDDSSIYHQLVKTLDLLGETQTAHATLLEGIRKHPNNSELVNAIIERSTETQTRQTTLTFFEELWRNHPHKMIAHGGFQLARHLRQWPEALRWAERESKLSPERINPILHQGVALQALEEWDKLILLYQTGLVQHPSSHQILNNLAWSYTQHGSNPSNLQIAEELAQSAIELSNGQRAAYFDTLAAIYWKQGNRKEAKTALQKALILKPESLLYQKRLEEYTD